VNNNSNSKKLSRYDTVLAHINDPAPQPLIDSETRSEDPHEQVDDETVLAHINGPAKTDE
jgi:hypothetical protein